MEGPPRSAAPGGQPGGTAFAAAEPAAVPPARAPRGDGGGWRRSAALVGLVAVLAGLLFALNARSARGSDVRDAPGLRGMLTARDREVAELQARNEELSQAVADLVERAQPAGGETDPLVALAAGAVEVAGPGVKVTLADAQPPDVLGEAPETPSDALVHQQDIDAVMNALWAGGAEALAVQGHRINSNTAVKCVGNVILVAGRVYSPPYTVAAIGPEQDMRARLDAAPLVRSYRDRAARLGLTWSVEGADRLVIPADAAGSGRLRYARSLGSKLDGSTP